MGRSLKKRLYLDRPTSHGGWGPESGNGSWNNSMPVSDQIYNWLESMGLADEVSHGRLSESGIRKIQIIAEANVKQMQKKTLKKIKDEAVVQGVSIDVKDTNTWLTGMAGLYLSEPLKVAAGAGYLVDGAFFVKAIYDLNEAKREFQELDEMFTMVIGRPVMLTSDMDINFTNRENVALFKLDQKELMSLRRQLVKASTSYTRVFMSLLSAIPDEFLLFASWPITHKMAKGTVRENLNRVKWIQETLINKLPFIKRLKGLGMGIGDLIDAVTGSFHNKLISLLGFIDIDISDADRGEDDSLKIKSDASLNIDMSDPDIYEDPDDMPARYNKSLSPPETPALPPPDDELDKITEARVKRLVREAVYRNIRERYAQ